ncbi:MAG: hypothetical protein ACKVY0_10960 [Prosthecobacter sp.]
MNNNPDGELPLNLPRDAGRALSSLELARLNFAGDGSKEIKACEAVSNDDARGLLIEFFCDARPNNWQKLVLMVALMRWKIQRGDMRPIGGDIITNAAKFHFPECEGNNDFRLLYPRALAIVCPELVKLELLRMEDDSKANVLFDCGWQAPDSVDWQAIKAWEPGEQRA